jgi:MerR family mercuric resistance operon transcriptional regulator
MKIGELARAGGVNVETIRYYQRRGLLAQPARHEGPRRYTRSDLGRLQSIRSAQTAGFTLDEIATLLALDTGDRTAAQDLARARIAALDEKIATLQTMRGALVRLADDCALEQSGPCPIIDAFSFPQENAGSQVAS